MGASRALEQTLDDILSAIKPSQENLLARNQIIDELRTIVHSMNIFRGAIVEPFGSFVSGLSTRWGDLDISIELPQDTYISTSKTQKKRTSVALLWALLLILKALGRFNKLQFVQHVRVPIVKFKSRGISCDVSIDNPSGQMKSKLLLWIKGMDERFGDMVLLVKEWAKAQEINNPMCGSFNSYGLTLLVIFHFQTCVPAILPPLKDIYPGDIASDLKVKGVRADVVRNITETCAANIAKWKSNRYRPVNRSSLSELSVSFFSKFSDISRKAKDLGICPYKGKWEALSSNDAIFIEDPFEPPLNAAKTVKPSLMRKISEAFETTYQRVSSTYETEASLLPGLARPRVLKALARTPSTAGSYSGNHDTTNCSVLSNVASSSQVQQQFQNMTLQPHGMIQKSPTGDDRIQSGYVPTLESETHPNKESETDSVDAEIGSESETDSVDAEIGPDQPVEKRRPVCVLFIFLSLLFLFEFFLS
ncbi:hypothetical protein BT93_J0861 [Corymbia citriodora subsp. variegata]|nr:hypothetical protein BT93_J0861 [Corymbia citriodora subsp. variegata]